jgi:hypothetical protein
LRVRDGGCTQEKREAATAIGEVLETGEDKRGSEKREERSLF